MVLNKMTSQKPLFLIRPPSVPQEGIAEYLQRLAKANGLGSVSMICHLLQVTFTEIISSDHAKIQAVIHGEADAQSLKNATTSSRDQSQGPYPARVCISCLQENDLLSSDWSKPLAISCQKHQKLLQDHCPCCFRLILSTESQYFCKCGQVFSELEPQPAPAWESIFREFFILRKMPTHQLRRLKNIDRMELLTAKLLRKIINASGKTRAVIGASLGKNRIFTSDHVFLEKSAITHFDFSYLWETAPWLAEQLSHLQRQIERQNIDGSLNVSRAIGCTINTASNLLKNPGWRIYIRKIGTATLRPNSVVANLRSILDATYSMQEIFKTIGIPLHWEYHFGRFQKDVIKLIPTQFPAWRLPKWQCEHLELMLHRCRAEAQSVNDFPDGFLRISDIPPTSQKLQAWVQQQMMTGTLKLVYEDDSPRLRLIDFSIPVASLSEIPTHGNTKMRIKRLTRFPVSTQNSSCHS